MNIDNNQPKYIPERTKTTSYLTLLITILGCIIAAASIYFLVEFEVPNKSLKSVTEQHQGETQIGGDFILRDQDHNLFDSRSLRGKLVLVYFGFSYCPDICPTSLNKLTEVIDTLDRYRISVTPLFITIDPTRDTSSVIKEYLSHFHPKIIGLTGSEAEIAKVASMFKVYYARSKGTQESGKEDKSYMVDHSSFSYFMDENGKYIRHFHFDSKADEIVNLIRVYYSNR
jgi:protein SCO1/2